MVHGVRLHVWGEYACFTRPEMKVERVSYNVMTPSAARGILEAIHWKPAIRWVVDRIHVLRPIRFESFRRNELGSKASPRNIRAAMKKGATVPFRTCIEKDRQQRAATLLRDVAYVIEAHVLPTRAAGSRDTASKHLTIFNRRAKRGQCFHRPYLGTRECAADFAPVGETLPPSALPPSQRDQDLGWMLHDLHYGAEITPRFFRAALRNGAVDVPPPGADGVRA